MGPKGVRSPPSPSLRGDPSLGPVSWVLSSAGCFTYFRLIRYRFGMIWLGYLFTSFDKRQHKEQISPLSSYMFPIIWLFWYVNFFLALSIITFPLSVYITTIFARAPDLGHLVPHVFFDNKMIVLDSLLINFATLSNYAQSFICLLKFLGTYVCFVVRDQVVSTVSLIIHEIHHSRKKISYLSRSFLIFWVSLSLLSQFLNDNIGKIKLLMAVDIHPHPGQVDVGLKFCHWNLNGIIARDRIKTEVYNSVFIMILLLYPRQS